MEIEFEKDIGGDPRIQPGSLVSLSSMSKDVFVDELEEISIALLAHIFFKKKWCIQIREYPAGSLHAWLWHCHCRITCIFGAPSPLTSYASRKDFWLSPGSIFLPGHAHYWVAIFSSCRGVCHWHMVPRRNLGPRMRYSHTLVSLGARWYHSPR